MESALIGAPATDVLVAAVNACTDEDDFLRRVREAGPPGSLMEQVVLARRLLAGSH